MGPVAITESDGLQIDIGENIDPFEAAETPKKETVDRSMCQLKPSEGCYLVHTFFHYQAIEDNLMTVLIALGRMCREDEPMPRSNLQYFYSRKDKRCKLFFYRGCGGNQNRFETKRQCQAVCKVLFRNIILLVMKP